MKKIFTIVMMLCLSAFTVAGYSNGFETDNSGWDVFGGAYDAVRVASGNNGIPSADGSYHAESSTAATKWGGYSDTFPSCGYYTTQVDIYLEHQDDNDLRFDLSSAINTPSGDHRRDFIFNCGFYDDESLGDRFVCSASNNAPGWPKNPGRDPQTFYGEGWYTFVHTFNNLGGTLSVDLDIYRKSDSAHVGSWTLSDPTDVIGSTVGGNRYGWFAYNDFPFLAIDNSEKTECTPGNGEIPEFTTIGAALALLGAGYYIRRKRR